MAFLGESELSTYSPEMLEERACTLFRIYDQNKDGQSQICTTKHSAVVRVCRTAQYGD